MLRELTILGSLLAAPAAASAGGLFLPGSGAISSARAGAAVASVDDGEALGINPAGLAKTHGTTITLSAAAMQYSMRFTRSGTYDAPAMPDDDQAGFVGTPYGTIENDPTLPLGVGSFQPIPVVAIASDLGGAVPNLRVAGGLYAPNAYPFRDMSGGYVFNDNQRLPPPPTRYDIIKQEAAVFLPSIAASYRINAGARRWRPAVVGHRAAQVHGRAVGRAGQLRGERQERRRARRGRARQLRPGGGPGRDVPADAGDRAGRGLDLDGRDPGQGHGRVLARPGRREPRRHDGLDPPSATPRCDPAGGGTVDALKACVSLQIPMTATIGGRYKLLDAGGGLRGDVELDIGWENWGKRCDFIKDPGCTSPSQYRVVVDAEPHLDSIAAPPFKDSIVEHRLNDTFSFRLGGSYHLPLGAAPGASRIILRGGVAYDTRAAEEGWLRADVDGAARLTTTVGGAYRTGRYEIDVGAGYVYEGKNTNSGSCNPTSTAKGCAGSNSEAPIDERSGPDPINPLVVPAAQAESPVNQGTIESSYLMFMVGVSTWF